MHATNTNTTANSTTTVAAPAPAPAVLAINNDDVETDEFFNADAVSTVSPFQTYWEDQNKVNPKNKLKLLFCVAASGQVNDFSLADLQEDPFKDQPGIRPAREVLRAEVKRRDPTVKTLVRHTVKELMEFMVNTNHHLTPGCKEFVQKKFAEVKQQLQKAQE